jgi:dipeptidyl aminopeptidase/acylaminoacyl peptidase
MFRRLSSLVLTLAAALAALPLHAWSVRAIDDLILLKRVGSPAISPDGRWVALTVRETNWDDSTYETEIWLAETATGQVRQMTNARKSSMEHNLQWFNERIPGEKAR